MVRPQPQPKSSPRTKAVRLDPASTLIDAGLRYTTYTQPGISRVRSDNGFRYLGPAGEEILSAEVLLRIRTLGIPPAWTDVWISIIDNGHLQAVGRDAKGRRQYRYHRLWRAVRDAAKFDQLLDVARVLPVLRRRVEQDLALPGLPREKVLATVVWLLERTLIRVGNDEYARDNQSFGLTTLQDRHVQINGECMRFEFRGKSGKYHVVTECDPRVAKIVKQSQDLPGQELFQYVDLAGDRRDVASEHVNDYLQEIAGQNFTAKIFRTWMATVHALDILRQAGPPAGVRQAKAAVNACIRAISKILGNTPAIARKAYIHPAVIEKYTSGELDPMFTGWKEPASIGLSSAERATVRFLQKLVA